MSSTAFPNWYVEFQTAVLRQLPRPSPRFERENGLRWSNDQSALRLALEGVFLPAGAEVEIIKPDVYPIVLSYSLTLPEMIAAGNYDDVNRAITAERFPLTGTGEHQLHPQLVHLDRDISSDHAEIELDRLNLRPAKIEELLAFGAKYPKVQLNFPIIALGSVAKLGGLRHVASLGRYGTGRRLALSYRDYGWSRSCRFLALAK